jgi:ribosomal protein S19
LPFTSRRFNRLSLRNDVLERLLDEEESVFLRRFMIPRSLDGLYASVYNGFDLIDYKLSRRKVGHRFGEFAVTKILGADYRFSFGTGKKKKKNKKKRK